MQLLAVAAVVLIVAGWALAKSRDGESIYLSPGATIDQPSLATNAAVEGDRLPDAVVQLLDGTDVEIASLVGQPMVINFWGSTCAACKKELPAFAAVHQQYQDQVRFVGIDYLPPSTREETFARDRGVRYELLYDSSGEFINEVGVAAFPVTLFVDRDGIIVRQTGLLDETKLTEIIEDELL